MSKTCHSLHAGDPEPFLSEEIWTPGDPADLPTRLREKTLANLTVEPGWRYEIHRYSCRILLKQPTLWGADAPQIQAPFLFAGRQQWTVTGASVSVHSKGLDKLAPPSESLPTWSGFLAFEDYGVFRGDPVLVATKSQIGITLWFGQYEGSTLLPPPPYDRLFYLAVLSGFRYRRA